MEDERETRDGVGMETVPNAANRVSADADTASELAGSATAPDAADQRERAAEPADSDVTWRALPSLGNGLARTLAAGGLGVLAGVVWGVGGRSAPVGFVAALGWALALGAAPLLAMAAGVAFDGDLRPRLG